MLKKEDILSAQDLPFEDVPVAAWGGSVRVSTMTGTARDAYEVSLMDQTRPGQANLENVRARILVFTLVDESGARMFTEAEIAALGAKSAKELDKLYAVACRLNGIGQKEIDQLGKISAAAPGGASTTT